MSEGFAAGVLVREGDEECSSLMAVAGVGEELVWSAIRAAREGVSLT